jgi:hypothetical protein
MLEKKSIAGHIVEVHNIEFRYDADNQRVGIYLPEPVFAHGQLYTAFSRGKRGGDVSVLIEDNKEGFTDNIVYKELL